MGHHAMPQYAMTIEEWRQQQEGSTRPVTDPCMSTARADQGRRESAIVSSVSAEDDLLTKLVEDRKRRNTAATAISLARDRRLKRHGGG